MRIKNVVEISGIQLPWICYIYIHRYYSYIDLANERINIRKKKKAMEMNECADDKTMRMRICMHS
jgi:hypothetical protein